MSIALWKLKKEAANINWSPLRSLLTLKAILKAIENKQR